MKCVYVLVLYVNMHTSSPVCRMYTWCVRKRHTRAFIVELSVWWGGRLCLLIRGKKPIEIGLFLELEEAANQFKPITGVDARFL